MLADLVLTLGPGTTGPMYVYFFHDAKGFNEADVGYLLIYYIGAGLIGAPVWGRVARRFGKHRTVQIACVCYGITQTILMAHTARAEGLPLPARRRADRDRHVQRGLLRQRLHPA